MHYLLVSKYEICDKWSLFLEMVTYVRPPPPPPEQVQEQKSNHLADSCSAALTSPLELLKMKILVHTQWNVEDVLLTFGCRPKCTSNVHRVTAYDLLWIHSEFLLPRSEQKLWMLEYLSVNCPNAGVSGAKDAKGIAFLICGKLICQTLWLKALPLCSSRFYSIRNEFLSRVTKSSAVLQHRRRMSTKSVDALSWMEAYFRAVGDKQPDKHGIYLPTCLTKKSIYHRMVDEKYNGNRKSAVCFSQFNRLFRKHFRHVTIPKVSS